MNCLFQDGLDGCKGGYPGDVYDFAAKNGIPHDSCQTYLAANPDDATCSGEWVCEDCKGTPGSKDGCYAKTPKSIWAADHGEVSGAADMKQEIYQRGPIACGVSVNDNFEK